MLRRTVAVGDTAPLRRVEAALGRREPVSPTSLPPGADALVAVRRLLVRERARRGRRLVLSAALGAGAVLVGGAAIGRGSVAGGLVCLWVALAALLLAPQPTRRWRNLLALTVRVAQAHHGPESVEALLELVAAAPTGEGAEAPVRDALLGSLARTLSFLPGDAPLSPRTRELLVAQVEAGVRAYIGDHGAPVALGGFLIAGLLTLDARGEPRVVELASVLRPAVREQRLLAAVLECLREPTRAVHR